MGDTGLLERIALHLGLTPTASVTVGALFMMYKSSWRRGRGWQLERNLLRPFVVRHWRRRAADLTPADWNAHRRSRRREPTRTGRPPTELTINLELAAAKRMFKLGVRRKLLDERPFADVKPVKTKTRRESWFTSGQIDRLLGAASSLRWRHQQLTFYALVAAMADTGLRISEALALRWDRITLQATTSVLGKGSKTRVVGFTDRALRAMGALDRHANPHVFVNSRRGGVYDASTVRAWFRTAIAAAGLEGCKADGDFALVPHILRHSFASIADERGAPLTWIQNAMGHSEPSTTMIYLHRDEHDAARKMAAIMGNRRGPRRSEAQSGDPLKKDLVKRERKSVTFVS